LEWLGCLALERTLRWLPHPALVRLSEGIATLVYALDHRGRSIALANLEAVFGDRFSAEERDQIAAKSYENFALTMLELFWAQGISPETFAAQTEVKGFEPVLQRAAREGRGIAFACAHIGNWEWAALTFAQLGGTAQIVTQTFRNPRLTPLFSRLRKHEKHTLISQERAMLKLLKSALRGEHTALLPDLNLGPQEGAVLIRVFGPEPFEICVPQLHAVLALRANALLVPVVTDRLPGGKLSIEALPPVEIPPEATAAEIVQKTWDLYEPHIRRKPELWIWAYKHFRFVPRNAPRPYPFYAKSKPEFEALRKASPGFL
jgi:KDO2-lipid IV(A) lauroyltransferase